MIKLLTSIAGSDFSYQVGEVVTLDKEYESRLIASGQAEAVIKFAPKKKAVK